ncbi:MAG TPA: hypothetical protein VIL99_04745, partial [Ignavibacteria bacterium]
QYLYKNNKVKTEIIDYSDGSKIVTKYNKSGNPIEIMYYNDNNKIRLVTCKYDNSGNKSEDSYLGYESGDMWSVYFYYDGSGSIIKTKVIGSDDGETYFQYDEQGNLIQTKWVEIGTSQPVSYITEYKNIYENGNLASQETICNSQTGNVIITRFYYENNNVIKVEEDQKNCKDNCINFYSRKAIIYFDNGLVKETTFESSYMEVSNTGVYNYEFY